MTRLEPSREPPGGPRGAASVPRWLQVGAAWSWRLLLLGAAVLAAVLLLRRVQLVVLPVLIALGAASVLGPPARKLELRGWRPALAAWAVLGSALLVLGGLAAALAPSVAQELSDVGDSLGDAQADIEEWLRDGPLGLEQRDIDRLEDALRDGGSSGFALGSARRGVTLALELVTGALLALVLTFFFVKDGAAMWGWVVARVAPERQALVARCGGAARRTLSAYLLGVAMAGLVEGVAIGVGLWLIGVPLVIPLAVITFFAAFVPIVGATVAGALAALVALANGGTNDALLAAGLAVIVQQLDGDVIQPLIMRRQVKLHPVVVLVSLAAGGVVAGIVGAVLAVPVAAVGSAVAHEVRQSRLVPAGSLTGSALPSELPGPSAGARPA